MRLAAAIPLAFFLSSFTPVRTHPEEKVGGAIQQRNLGHPDSHFVFQRDALVMSHVLQNVIGRDKGAIGNDSADVRTECCSVKRGYRSIEITQYDDGAVRAAASYVSHSSQYVGGL